MLLAGDELHRLSNGIDFPFLNVRQHIDLLCNSITWIIAHRTACVCVQVVSFGIVSVYVQVSDSTSA